MAEDRRWLRVYLMDGARLLIVSNVWGDKHYEVMLPDDASHTETAQALRYLADSMEPSRAS